MPHLATTALRRLIFLREAPKIRFLLVLATLVVIACGGRAATPGPTNCANVGCGAPPLCSEGCQAACGCCRCTAGERVGDLLCSDRGCYVPANAPDAGSDGGTDGGSDAATIIGTDADGGSDAATITGTDAGTGSDAAWSPAPACALPFDTGPCEAAIPVYAFVNGSCVARTYGGCQGNGNRFPTLEECMATCEGRPIPLGCPTGRTAQALCLACAPNDACSRSLQVCALTCDQTAAANTCPTALPTCQGGVCRAVPCG